MGRPARAPARTPRISGTQIPPPPRAGAGHPRRAHAARSRRRRGGRRHAANHRRGNPVRIRPGHPAAPVFHAHGKSRLF
ncbi:MAG TPA: hypothetical protein DCQ92_04540 [Verrucomicrobia subdivision 3 bacterium]|nr:hypothetical protein [Limisphaerales bacterium]